MKNKDFWYAIAIMIGTIIGAGFFGLPYAINQSGFLIGCVMLIVFGFLSLYLHLMYGEVVLRTPGLHRYSGFLKKYLPNRFGAFAGYFNVASSLSYLLVYLVLGGIFSHSLFNQFFGGSENLYTIIFFIFVSIGIIFSLHLFNKLNLILVLILLSIILLICIWGSFSLDINNLARINWHSLLVPYGVILFSLSGNSAVPEMVEVLKKKQFKVKKAIIIGTLIPYLIYLFFIIVVLGLSGNNTTEDAISGLVNYLGKPVIILGTILGLIAVSTSFFVTALNLKKILWYDYQVKEIWSSIATLVFPIGLFLLGLKDFIGIISFLGIFFISFDNLFFIKIFLLARKKGSKRVSYRIPGVSFMPYLITSVLILGVLLETYFTYLKNYFHF